MWSAHSSWPAVLLLTLLLSVYVYNDEVKIFIIMKTYVTRSYLPAIKNYNITQLQLWMVKGFVYGSPFFTLEVIRPVYKLQ